AFAPAGSHLFRFSRRSLRLALQSTARRNETNKTICIIKKKNEPLIKQVDEWFVFYLGSTTFVPVSLS
ncbi:hypothetical protein P4606_26860, partial [Priestia aryabhattai]|uniref:hypothetical protein n=1 Tax=Priestia aryabhattai TaxID=412384 RepID=UPI002E1C8DCC|nr:hypothetical protein [Priestia aryabhattai]